VKQIATITAFLALLLWAAPAHPGPKMKFVEVCAAMALAIGGFELGLWILAQLAENILGPEEAYKPRAVRLAEKRLQSEKKS
jgi:hypothetical protein